MICSHCSKKIPLENIAEQRGKGFRAQIRCPACSAWLGRSVWPQRLKLVGFYWALAMALLAWWQPGLRGGLSVAAMLGVITLFIAHLMDQLQVVERPPQVDNSAERQRYR
ncbi:hypothetical protein HR45_14505 [Shewanella mangrovi]|uniref:Uncharacterized protein n=1 Tax=Shewanella mangrovi TaxID=1515746 RepID=A0A094JFM7_9GAMM|nr:hypothetical protein [Shewanella mangrovi]KFZ36824.1 hypothetical protein HR45_14505 [Shewanella mangrovi]